VVLLLEFRTLFHSLGLSSNACRSVETRTQAAALHFFTIELKFKEGNVAEIRNTNF
jgi:hypothetical protein